MNKLLKLLAILLLILNTSKSYGQVYAPNLQGWTGYNVIFYPFGYYQGYIVNGIAHGSGVFYYADGSFYSGNFFNGFFDGPGMFASPMYGYVSGCFSQGVYMGECIDIPNPYQTTQQVKNTISQVQSNRPTSTSGDPNAGDYQAVNVDDYKIVKVSSTEELGGYSHP